MKREVLITEISKALHSYLMNTNTPISISQCEEEIIDVLNEKIEIDAYIFTKRLQERTGFYFNYDFVNKVNTAIIKACTTQN